jgi:type IV pilus assembly protein PilN
MIRINLLGERKKKKKVGPPPRFLVVFLAVLLGSLLVAGFATVYFKSKVSQLRSQSEENKAKLATLAKKISEVKKFESLNKEYLLKTNLIEKLRENQSIPVRILDQVSSALPEGVWVNGLSYRGNNVAVEGFAFTNIDVVAYVDNLKKAPGVTNVTLLETRETQVEKVTVYKYSLVFTLGA